MFVVKARLVVLRASFQNELRTPGATGGRAFELLPMGRRGLAVVVRLLLRVDFDRARASLLGQRPGVTY